MRQMVLWDTACNFNGFISNQSIFNCLITGASTLVNALLLLLVSPHFMRGRELSTLVVITLA